MGLEEFWARKIYKWVDVPLVTYVGLMNKPQTLMTKRLASDFYLDHDKREEAQSICIVREGGIGDLIMLSSAINGVKAVKPSLKIKLVTGPMGFQVLGGASFIDEMVLYEKYNPVDEQLVVDLLMRVEPQEMGGFLSLHSYANENRIDVFHRLLNVEKSQRNIWISIDDKKVEMWKRTLSPESRTKPLIAIHATCTARARTIPPQIIFDLAWMLAKDFTVLIIGKTESWHKDSPIDLKQLGGSGIINLMDKTDISEMIALISITDFIIAPDSGVLHIAGALGIKGVGIFGNIIPMTRCKYYPTIKTMFPEGALKCIPCHDLWHCELSGKVGAACMNVFSAKDIHKVAMEWWNDGRKNI